MANLFTWLKGKKTIIFTGLLGLTRIAQLFGWIPSTVAGPLEVLFGTGGVVSLKLFLNDLSAILSAISVVTPTVTNGSMQTLSLVSQALPLVSQASTMTINS